MRHIVKLIQRHYGDQSDFVIVCLLALLGAALMVGVALFVLQ